jgi:hypothetical protein
MRYSTVINKRTLAAQETTTTTAASVAETAEWSSKQTNERSDQRGQASVSPKPVSRWQALPTEHNTLWIPHPGERWLLRMISGQVA